MGVRLTTVLATALLAWSGSAVVAQAQSRNFNPAEFPINQPTVLEAATRIDGETTYWDDVATLEGDAIFLFGAPTYKDNDLFWAGKRINAFYRDLLRQQGSRSIARTPDLETPFCETMAGQMPPCQVSVQPPMTPPQPIYYPPVYQPPARPVPARF